MHFTAFFPFRWSRFMQHLHIANHFSTPVIGLATQGWLEHDEAKYWAVWRVARLTAASLFQRWLSMPAVWRPSCWGRPCHPSPKTWTFIPTVCLWGCAQAFAPFNFPAMIPLWMFPMAMVCGNTFLMKPSERVPGATMLLMETVSGLWCPWWNTEYHHWTTWRYLPLWTWHLIWLPNQGVESVMGCFRDKGITNNK